MTVNKTFTFDLTIIEMATIAAALQTFYAEVAIRCIAEDGISNGNQHLINDITRINEKLRNKATPDACRAAESEILFRNFRS